VVSQAGTSYSNAQIGLYNSSGTLLSQTPIYASGGTNKFGSLGVASANLDAAQAISGGPTVFVWLGLHIGVNNSTAVGCFFPYFGSGTTASVNPNLATSVSRFGYYTGHATNSLQTIGNLTPASITQSTGTYWMGFS
jgi:hypothetical protein